MPFNADDLRSRLEPEYVSVEPPYEIVYPLSTPGAFQTINGAVFYTLSRLDPLQEVYRDEVSGGAVYHISYAGGITQLFVLHITDYVACIRLHRIAPMAEVGRDYCWQPSENDREAEQLRGLAAVIQAIHTAIVELLGCATRFEQTVPPPPPATDLQMLFVWQEIYHPEMPDKELAMLVDVSHQTIRNARTRMRHTKRATLTPRGKVRN